MEGYATLLRGTLAAEGWLELVPLRFVTLADLGLPVTSTDRAVWRRAQAEQMLLLTNNRNMDDEHSLVRTMREESTLASLPVITVGSLDRLMQQDYRRRCAERLEEIVLDLHRYLGTGRIFIP
jgi:hypothetical protein